MSFEFELPLLLDGATGTNLMLAGLPLGGCVEKWVLDNPQTLVGLQQAYAAAGSRAVMAPTFEANRCKLSNSGYGDRVFEFNSRLVALSRGAVGDGVLVAGDISPTGMFIEPFGDNTFDYLMGIYREQALALRDAGVDYIAIETMTGLTEARAALLAAKETGLPVTVSMTVEKNGRTLSGGDITAALVTLASMGAAAVGVNCSMGPQTVLDALTVASPYLDVPLLAKPNAGIPRPDGSGYDLTAEEFAGFLPKYLSLGACLVGGCCGTTPRHISLLSEALGRSSGAPKKAPGSARGVLLAACERHLFPLGNDIDILDELECDDSLAEGLMSSGEETSGILKVTVRDMDGVGEFINSAYRAALPLMLSCDDDAVLEETLKVYQGRALVDSGCAVTRGRLTELSGRYGAVIV